MSNKLFYCMDCKLEIETPKNNCCPKCKRGMLLWRGSPDIAPLRTWVGDPEEVKKLRAHIAELEERLASETESNNQSANMAADAGKERDMTNTSGWMHPDYEMKEVRLERENKALHKRIAELEAAQQWYPASEPPESDSTVLLAIEWTNYAGKRVKRWCMAIYLRKHEEEYYGDCDDFGDYDEGLDVYYCPEGWYEFRNDEDNYLLISERELALLGWRELPPMPEKGTDT